MKSILVKEAQTDHPVLSQIKKRWSARSFSDKPIADQQMNTLFEAASWAASSNNEQPWEYYYAHRGTEGFQQIWDTMMPGNRPWADNAAVLVVAVVRKTFAATGGFNASAEHDLGMANAHLLLQAVSLEIFAHQIGGFDKGKMADLLGLDDHQAPLCIIALGYLDEPEKLEEPYRTRELTPRKRKGIGEFAHLVGQKTG